MTFNEYIINPSNERFGGFEREAFRTKYSQELDKILVKYNNLIEYKCLKSGTDYILYVRIPSEKTDNLLYDVLIKMSDPGDGQYQHIESNNSLNTYNVQFFSNDPAFSFDHAYVYKHNKLLFTDFEKKLPEASLKQKPTTTNPNLRVAYCKSIYWAYLIARQKGLLNKNVYTDTYNKNYLLERIPSTQEKMAEYNEKKSSKNNHRIPKSRKVDSTNGIKFNKGRVIDFSKGKDLNFSKNTMINYAKNKNVDFGKSMQKSFKTQKKVFG